MRAALVTPTLLPPTTTPFLPFVLTVRPTLFMRVSGLPFEVLFRPLPCRFHSMLCVRSLLLALSIVLQKMGGTYVRWRCRDGDGHGELICHVRTVVAKRFSLNGIYVFCVARAIRPLLEIIIGTSYVSEKCVFRLKIA